MENLKNINPIKVDKTTIINLEKGKLPPQALDLEEAVLGAMMIDKKELMRLLIYYNLRRFIRMRTSIFLKQFFSYSQILSLLTC